MSQLRQWPFLWDADYKTDTYMKCVCILQWTGRNWQTTHCVIETSKEVRVSIVETPYICTYDYIQSYWVHLTCMHMCPRCCTSILKIFKSLPNYLHRVTFYNKLRKEFGKIFRSYPEVLCKFGEISFQDYVLKIHAHVLPRWSSLRNKEG